MSFAGVEKVQEYHEINGGKINAAKTNDSKLYCSIVILCYITSVALSKNIVL